MPTLDELLNLLKEAPDMLINIELKCPHSPEIRALYDYENACAVIKTYIDQYQIDEERTIVSSYEPLMTTKMVEMAPKRQFKILQLLLAQILKKKLKISYLKNSDLFIVFGS